MSANINLSIFGVCATKLNTSHRWFDFVLEIQNKGYEIIEIGNPYVNIFISVDHSDENYKMVLANPSLKKKILILIEPPSVNPRQFEKKILSSYDLLITTPSLSDLVPNSYTWIPGFMNNKAFKSIDSSKPLSVRNFKFGLLATNKYSPMGSSLYQFRKLVLIEFSKRNILVSVGGLNWNQNWFWTTKEAFKSVMLNLKYFRNFNLIVLFQSLRLRKKDFNSVGRFQDSSDFYTRTQFVICIESDIYDFSEKIFEVIEAGAVPLYLGPDLSRYNLPKNLYYLMPPSPEQYVEKAIDISNLIVATDHFSNERNKKLTREEWDVKSSFKRLSSLCSVHFS
jgi:hypothetical protein